MNELQGNQDNIGLLRMYRVLFYVITGTSLVPMAFGYRDMVVMTFSVCTLLLGVIIHNKIKKNKVSIKEKRFQSIRNTVKNMVFFLVFIVAVFVVKDHVKMSVYAATILQEEGKYTTVQRCTQYKGKDICKHETKDQIKVYHFENGNIEKVEDITDVINKYTEK